MSLSPLAAATAACATTSIIASAAPLAALSRPARQLTHQRRTYISGRKLPRGGLHFVPHNHVWMVERFGKLHREQAPGFTIVLPFLERVAHVRGLAEGTIQVAPQHAVTRDNVQVTLDGVVYYKVVDARKSSYNISNPAESISTIAQAVMRKKVGSMELDMLFHNRNSLNSDIEESLAKLKEDWGIQVIRYEVQDITVDRSTSDAMKAQSSAERQKRADILASEGRRQAVINQAEGKRTEVVMLAEANKDRLIKEAEAAARQITLDGEAHAAATRAQADAEAEAIRKIAAAIGEEKGAEAVAANMAKSYLSQLPTVFSKANTMVVPSDPMDVSAMVTKAMAIAKGPVKLE